MSARRALLIPLLLALPTLAGCGRRAEPVDPGRASVVADPGAPRAQLAAAVDAVFADKEAGETRALLVLHNGKQVAERYAPGFGPATRQIGWSMSKCVTALMTGMLVADGRLRLDGGASVPAWQRPGDSRGAVTVRMLLQMRSGLRHAEGARPVTEADTTKMLFLEGRDDMAAYAEGEPLESTPGNGFRYSTANSVILADVAARILSENGDPAARQRAVSDYLRSRLFEPAGMHSMTPEFDAHGTMIGGAMIWGSARDWGRLGELLRNGGRAGDGTGAQLVPRAWIDLMLTPSPGNPAYGGQVWLNRKSTVGREWLWPGRAPRDVFACIGHRGQYVIVSPSQKLTLVRLGQNEGEPFPPLRERLLAILRLFPAR